MGIVAFLFRENGLERNFQWQGRLPDLTEHELLWLDVQDEDHVALNALMTALPVGDRGRSALRQEEPGLRHWGDHVRVRVDAPDPVPDGKFQVVPVQILAARNLVVTFHDAPAPFLEELVERLHEDSKMGELDSAAFLAVMLNFHLESFYALLSPLEDAIDELDDRVLRHLDRDDLRQLVGLRQRVSDVRRLLGSHRLVYAGLASPDFTVFQGDQPELLLTRLFKQYEHAYDAIAHTRDMILGSFDLYMTSTGQRTNEIMRVLTLATLVLGMLAVVTGVFGTNFENVHIFKSGDAGFRDMLLASGVLVLGTVGLARWRRWL